MDALRTDETKIVTARLIAGLVLLYAVLQGVATLLKSTRGEWGLAVAACVFLGAWAVQRTLHNEGLREIGVRAGGLRGLVTAIALSAALVAAAAIYVRAVGASVSVYPNALWLAIGILAQAGLAEELAFRGYFYGHLRRTRRFWRAALMSVPPFAAVHLTGFLTMDWPIALAALALSVALSFPYAYLYDLGARTIWAPALMHAVTQGGVKLFVVEDAAFPLVWMALVLALTWCVFLFPRKGSASSGIMPG